MKIIKYGKLPIHRFECTYCGCIFEANKKEYNIYIFDGITYTQCTCPCCDSQVIQENNIRGN